MGNEQYHNIYDNEINFGHFQLFSEDLNKNLLIPVNKLEDKISNELKEIDNFINENSFKEENDEEKIIEEEKSFDENYDIDTNLKKAETKKKIRDFINKISFESDAFVNDFSKEIIHINNTRENLFKFLMN
jgi:hypothetical protein